MSEKRRRRWYQYSLRAMLVFVLLFSIAMSWLGAELRRARNQLRAAKAITKAGGSIGYVDANTKVPEWLQQLVGKEFFRDLVRVSLAGTHVNDTVVAQLEGLTTVTTLYLDGTQATDTGLEHLQGLTSLETLYLDGTQVTDAGLEHLEGMTRLGTLSLGGTQVNGAGLAHLGRLTGLTTLYLGGTRVNDRALEHVAALKSVKTVYLDGAPVTDAGLEHLEGLASLRTLRLDGTLVTDEGVKNLRAALPGCRVIHWHPSDAVQSPAPGPPAALPTVGPAFAPPQ